MAEYIEREALKEHLKSYAGMFTDEIGFAVSLESVLGGIDFQPAADVVEVVRCKDCEAWEENPWCKGEMVCKYWADWLPTEPDDFCSYGERRNNDATD